MSYKIYDLSEPFGDGTPMWPPLVAEMRYPKNAFTGIPPAAFGGLPDHLINPMIGWPNEGRGTYEGHMHPATHMDAPVYCIDHAISVDQIPLENCYGTGVVVDLRNKKRWDTITAADLEKAAPKIERGDIVVVNTGWHKWWRVKVREYYYHYPGLVKSAAEWLIKKKVKAIAGTWAVCDHSLSYAPLQKNNLSLYEEYMKETGKDPGKEFPDYEPCLTMLLQNGIVCIHGAGGDIDKVTGKRCTLAAFPFRLERADAAMVRLVAIVEE